MFLCFGDRRYAAKLVTTKSGWAQWDATINSFRVAYTGPAGQTFWYVNPDVTGRMTPITESGYRDGYGVAPAGCSPAGSP